MSENEILQFGMVGGGPGSFIGPVHLKAATLDGKAELVGGAFSRTYEKTLQRGEELGLPESRLYKDYKEMAQREGAKPKKERIDFVSITTPNTYHYKIAKAFLQQSINVVCDKPLTTSVSKSEELKKLAETENLLFCVTYTYSGYPLVKHAKELINSGELGEIRVVQGEYPQEWLSTPLEKEGNKQATWRTDPDLAGASNCVGDIGTHIENTVSYMTGLKIDSLSADLNMFGEDRELDDNAQIMVRYEDGARGSYWCSQVAIGYDNALKIRVFGSKGSVEWTQEEPNHLKVSYLDKPTQVLSRGRDSIADLGADLVRLPAGHPEGYYEAFANVYANFEDALLEKKSSSTTFDSAEHDYPTVEDGLQGVKFIHKCLSSNEKGAKWVDF
ncbi:MAG: Gfo/Idh/MocA family oxidoreductase [Candidatus Bipolaricaulota bacterium]